MPAVIERLREAINQHDPDAMVECFDPDYRSEQPAHPNRIRYKEQVHKNWSGMFESYPDLKARVLRRSTEGDVVVWNEWLWSATGLRLAGVRVMGIREDRIAWARLYMEPVEEAGQDIDEAMRTITGSDQENDE